jgi:hypothetical protein
MLEPAVSGDAVVRSPADAGTQLGKRYAEESMGLELLCTKAGAGRLACNGKDLEIRSAKPLPSSD